MRIKKTIDIKIHEKDLPLYMNCNISSERAGEIWRFIRHIRKHNPDWSDTERLEEVFYEFDNEELVYALIVFGKTEKDEVINYVR